MHIGDVSISAFRNILVLGASIVTVGFLCLYCLLALTGYLEGLVTAIGFVIALQLMYWLRLPVVADFIERVPATLSGN